MEFATQIVPAIAVVLANVLGGDHNSHKYEFYTAIFGWTAALGLISGFIVSFFASDIAAYFYQVGAFGLITALARDYEKLLKLLLNKKGD